MPEVRERSGAPVRRERFIAGNWKMNKGASESLEFLRKLSVLLEQGEDIPDAVNMALFPQAVNIIPMADHIRSSGVNVLLGIQNIHCKPSGAFTGENSIPCAIEAGAKLALVGHSERRHIFREDDLLVSNKYLACLEQGIEPLLCVGETEEERNRGLTKDVIERQVSSVFSSDRVIMAEQERILIAYEPVWAIGTGMNATAGDARECCALIRDLLSGLGGPSLAARSLISYGGSVKSSNSEDYLEQEEIDGLLIGGASLDPDEFYRIICNAF